MLGDFQSRNPKATSSLCQHTNKFFDGLSLAHWSIVKELETLVRGGALVNTYKRDTWATGAGAGTLLACRKRGGYSSSSAGEKLTGDIS